MLTWADLLTLPAGGSWLTRSVKAAIARRTATTIDNVATAVAPRGPLAPTRVTVNEIAERGGVGLDGVNVHILDPVADADTIRYLDMQGAVARTDDLGIRLHPGAFADEDTLLRTLAHERTHVYQIQTFPNYGTGHMGAFESAAYGIEDSFRQYFLRGGQ